MKNFFPIVTLLAGLSANAAQTQSTDPLQTFAQCAGRLSAVMEYQWMFDGEASEQTALQRADLLDLIEAIKPLDQGRTVLHWRLSAKRAHSALLTRATFNQDSDDAAWALQIAKQQVANCTSLLLS